MICFHTKTTTTINDINTVRNVINRYNTLLLKLLLPLIILGPNTVRETINQLSIL